MKFIRRVDPGRAIAFPCAWSLLFVLINGCLEPYLPPSLSREQLGILVVDGFVVANDTTHIYLSRSRTLESTQQSVPEANAIVELETEAGNKYTLHENGVGEYTIAAVDISEGENCRIRIRTQDRYEYLSDMVTLKTSPPVDSVVWREVEKHDAIEFSIYAHDPENKTRFYLWTYDETYKYAAKAISIYKWENGQVVARPLATEIFYCYKTTFNNNIYLATTNALAEDLVYDFTFMEIPQYSRKLYYGYSIVVKQYALEEAAYNYWLTTKKNSESLGGLFDPLPTQPTGNLHCVSDPKEPVIGYFSATTLQQKRVFFNRQEIKGPSTSPYSPNPYGPTGYEDCADTILLFENVSDAALQGNLINDRAFNIDGTPIGYIIFPAECLDCRMKGGVAKTPPYWR